VEERGNSTTEGAIQRRLQDGQYQGGQPEGKTINRIHFGGTPPESCDRRAPQTKRRTHGRLRTSF